MDVLPRDIQLKIIGFFDIDTRIKTKTIFKLNVPNHVHDKLHKLMTFKNHVITFERGGDTTWLLDSPYNLYTRFGKHLPHEWLDRWYAYDWQQFYVPLYEQRLSEGFTKYSIVYTLLRT